MFSEEQSGFGEISTCLSEWVSELHLFTAGEPWGGTNSVSPGNGLEALRAPGAKGTLAICQAQCQALHVFSRTPWVNIMSWFSQHPLLQILESLISCCTADRALNVIYYSSQKSFHMIPIDKILPLMNSQYTEGNNSPWMEVKRRNKL